jgi:hypothetical protein
MKIKWATPPEPNRGRPADTRTDNEKFADALRKHPGDWAIWRDDANSSLAYQIKTGQVAAFRPARTFEAVCRSTGPGSGSRGTVYVRYIGNQTEEQDA